MVNKIASSTEPAFREDSEIRVIQVSHETGGCWSELWTLLLQKLNENKSFQAWKIAKYEKTVYKNKNFER